MKAIIALGLTILMLFAAGCSNDDAHDSAGREALNFDVIGTDTPASVDAALLELAGLSVVVPDPVEPGNPVLNQGIYTESAQTIVNNARLDDPDREYFRRILSHLDDQMNLLRRCMANNDDPRLRRLAHGATQAIQHGLRALQADEPRLALRYFRTANRVLNMAIAICMDRHERPGRP